MYSRFSRQSLFRPGIKGLLYIIILAGIGYLIAFSVDFAKRNDIFAFLSTQKQQATVGTINTLNPLFVQPYTLEHGLSNLLFAGLTGYDGQNQIIGVLADSWEVREGGKEFLFHLRKDASWSDGSQITAHDVIFTYQLTQNEQYQGWARDFFAGVEIEVVDEFTVLFTLPAAYMPFLDTVTLPILPRQVFLGHTPEQVQPVTFFTNGVYSGRYALKAGQRASLPNGVHYQRLVLANKDANEQFALMIFENESHMQTAFRLGVVDEMILQSPVTTIPDSGEMLITKPLLGQYSVLLLNIEKIGDAATRKAIIQAIDTTQIQGEPAIGPIPRQSPYWAEHTDTRVGFDRASAEQVLAGKEFTLSILNTPRTEEIARDVQKQLGAVGVKVNLKMLTTQEAFDSLIEERDFELLLISQHIGRDPDVYSFWHSSQIAAPGLNLVSLRNRRVDQALEKGRANAEFDVRKDAYSEFQLTFLEQFPAVFLTHPTVVIVSRDEDMTYSHEVWELEDLWLPRTE